MRRRNLLRSGVVATTGLGLGAVTAGPASPSGRRPRPLRVHTVLYDGVEEQDFAGPVEVFGIIDDRIKQTFVTADGPGTVITHSGMEIVIRAPWSPRTADLIMVPGGGYGDGSALSEQISRGTLPKALAAARRPGLTLAGVCTGTMLLSAAGITDGRPCTTHHIAKKDLAAEGGKVVGGRVVDDGDLVTCGGVTSGIDLALWLVERSYGPGTAVFAEEVLEYERRGTVWQAA
ncbi:DJ-1/PfpI family protein [Streptomyces sp. XD-27]|uniref:DJ-1/PfpI family protein n=1 Tax=Streptomyces sp. XD-27 TaxID=3062779 RepID=UPI0026F4769D|nr:DJ-1/PfpI family protein [Streptomyces sp. XD-27]WKX72782.1 DJ-1/PfpI family protein [Streptomyces sp. XD-27]